MIVPIILLLEFAPALDGLGSDTLGLYQLHQTLPLPVTWTESTQINISSGLDGTPAGDPNGRSRPGRKGKGPQFSHHLLSLAGPGKVQDGICETVH